MLVHEHLRLNCTCCYFRSFFNQERWPSIFFSQLCSAMFECSETRNELSLTSDSSWDAQIHGFSKSCGVAFGYLYKLYIIDLHGQCLVLFGWGCHLNKCEVCSFKQGDPRKQGGLKCLDASARVGFWVLFGVCRSVALFKPVCRSTKKSHNLCREGNWRCAMCLWYTNFLYNIHLSNQCTVALT